MLVLSLAACNSGNVKVKIENNLSESISVVSIQNETVNKTVSGNDSEQFTYKISRGGIPMSLQLQIGEEIIERDIVDYVERASHGKVTVTVDRDADGRISIDVDSDVTF